MPLPSFTIDESTTIYEILGEVAGGELSPAVLSAAEVTFKSNVGEDRFVTWDGSFYRIPPVKAKVTADGILRADNGPVTLLANDPGLSVEGLQWLVDVRIPDVKDTGRNVSGVTRMRSMRKWAFDAPADGVTVDLAATMPVTFVDSVGITRGPRGFTGPGFAGLTTTPDGLAVQPLVEGEEGPEPVGEPVELSAPMATAAETAVEGVAAPTIAGLIEDQVPPAVAAEAAEVVPPAVTADITARNLTVTDAGGGAAQFALGGVNMGAPFPLPAAAWSGVTGRDEGVKKATGGIVPIEKFNPDGVGFAAALSAAIDEADATGGTVVLEARKTYSIAAKVSKTDKHVRIAGNGAKIQRAASAGNFTALELIYSHTGLQSVVGVTTATYTPSSTTLQVDSQCARIELASTAGWAVGDCAVIVSDDQIPGAEPSRAPQWEGERFRVAAVEGNYLYASRPLRATFTTNVRIARMTQKDVLVEDLWVEDEPGSPLTRNAYAVEIAGAVNPRLLRAKVRNLLGVGVQFTGCFNGTIDGVAAYNLRHSPSEEYNSQGYGVRLVSCCDFTATGLTGEFLRHVFTTGAGQAMTADSTDLWRYGSNFGHRIFGGTAGEVGHAAFDFHEEASYCVIDGCRVGWNHREPNGTVAAFQLRGRNTTLMNSSSIGPGGLKILAFEGGGNFRVRNYTHTMMPAGGPSIAFGVLMEASGTSARVKTELDNVAIIAPTVTGSLFQLTRQSINAPYLKVVAANTSGTTQYLFDVTDCDLTIDTLVLDIRGSSSQVFGFRINDSNSVVRVNRLIVQADAASWGALGHLTNTNATLEIGELWTSHSPFSTLINNIGASATATIGDIRTNQRSIRDRLDTRTNADVTLSDLSGGTQLLTVALTAARTVTEPTSKHMPGWKIRYVRTAASTGAFNWTIGDLVLTTGQWGERTWTGTAWVTTGKGSL